MNIVGIIALIACTVQLGNSIVLRGGEYAELNTSYYVLVCWGGDVTFVPNAIVNNCEAPQNYTFSRTYALCARSPCFVDVRNGTESLLTVAPTGTTAAPFTTTTVAPFTTTTASTVTTATATTMSTRAPAITQVIDNGNIETLSIATMTMVVIIIVVCVVSSIVYYCCFVKNDIRRRTNDPHTSA